MEPARKITDTNSAIRLIQAAYGLVIGLESLRVLGAGYYGNYSSPMPYALLVVGLTLLATALQQQTTTVRFFAVVSYFALSSIYLYNVVLCFYFPPDVVALVPLTFLLIVHVVFISIYARYSCLNRKLSILLTAYTLLALLNVPIAISARYKSGDYASYCIKMYRAPPSISLSTEKQLLNEHSASVELIGRIGRSDSTAVITVVLQSHPKIGVQVNIPADGNTLVVHDANGWTKTSSGSEYRKSIVLIPAPQGVTVVKDRIEAGWHGFAVEETR